VYVGLEPNTAILKRLVDLDEDGRAGVDAWMRTERPGLLAVGAARRESAGYALTSAADGALAAVAAHKYVTTGEWR
jgi:thioredoxin reductase (NADPH)